MILVESYTKRTWTLNQSILCSHSGCIQWSFPADEKKKKKDISLRYKVHRPCKIFIWELDELTMQWRQGFYQRIKRREKVGSSFFVPCDLKHMVYAMFAFSDILSIINRHTAKTTSWLLCGGACETFCANCASESSSHVLQRFIYFGDFNKCFFFFFHHLLFRGPEWAPSWVSVRNLSSWQGFRSRRSCHRVCGRYSRIIYGSSCSSFNKTWNNDVK